MKTALVTGGAGYFGSLLARKLFDQGFRTRIYDLNSSDQLPHEITQYQGDILNEDDLQKALVGVDYVFHNVAQVPLANDVQKFWQVNRDGTALVLKCAVKAGVSSFIHTSSTAVFGIPAHNPMTERTPIEPVEEYGKAKAAAEELCLQTAATSGMIVQIIRPRTILGHGRLGIFQILFEWIYRGYNIPILGSGNNLFQFIHSDDLVEACLLAANQIKTGVYNCGTDRYETLRELITGLCEHAATGSRITSIPEPLAIGALKFAHQTGLSPLAPYHYLLYGKTLYFDITHAKTTLGWLPKYSNKEMLIESYNAYAANREKVLASSGRSLHLSPVQSKILELARFL